jgi:hypothetical protein
VDPQASRKKATSLILAASALLATAAVAFIVVRQHRQAPSARAPSKTAPAAKPQAGSATGEQKPTDKGSAPTISGTEASSATKKLGDPIELAGTLHNPNAFSISDVEVEFLHVCTGEERTAILFKGKKVPPNSDAPWKVSVTFTKGHFPDALIHMVNEWKRAQ